MALALASIACLEAMVKSACEIACRNDCTLVSTLSLVLNRVADEIILITTTAKAFTNALLTVTDGGDGARNDGMSRASMAKPSVAVLRRAWPTISVAVSKFSFDDVSKLYVYTVVSQVKPC